MCRIGEETESQDQIRGYFPGFTDDSGNFEYRFKKAGVHLLIAAKCGYTPDFQIIKITGPEPATAERVNPVQVEAVRIDEVKISLKSQ